MDWWKVFLGRMVRRMWFRAALFSLAAVVLALAGRFLAPYLPVGDRNIGQESVGSILTILASSMLAVTTFSLTVMVQAYSSATSNATPRATQLLVADSTSQNALSTFLGAFLFSIVGIIALSTGFYGDSGRILLFLGTVCVVMVIAVTLLRWIDHLTGFGRMADVIDRVETAAARGVASAPHFGGLPAVPIPDDATAVSGTETGYVTHLDVRALERVAREADLRIHVVELPGALVNPERTLVRVEGAVDDETAKRLCRAFTVEHHRVFDDDPRLGAIALAEIASRALSPSVNDPGTAIEVLNALQRVFRAQLETPAATEQVCERVFVPAISLDSDDRGRLSPDRARRCGHDRGDDPPAEDPRRSRRRGRRFGSSFRRGGPGREGPGRGGARSRAGQGASRPGDGRPLAAGHGAIEQHPVSSRGTPSPSCTSTIAPSPKARSDMPSPQDCGTTVAVTRIAGSPATSARRTSPGMPVSTATAAPRVFAASGISSTAVPSRSRRFQKGSVPKHDRLCGSLPGTQTSGSSAR